MRQFQVPPLLGLNATATTATGVLPYQDEQSLLADPASAGRRSARQQRFSQAVDSMDSIAATDAAQGIGVSGSWTSSDTDGGSLLDAAMPAASQGGGGGQAAAPQGGEAPDTTDWAEVYADMGGSADPAQPTTATATDGGEPQESQPAEQPGATATTETSEPTATTTAPAPAATASNEHTEAWKSWTTTGQAPSSLLATPEGRNAFGQFNYNDRRDYAFSLQIEASRLGGEAYRGKMLSDGAVGILQQIALERREALNEGTVLVQRQIAQQSARDASLVAKAEAAQAASEGRLNEVTARTLELKQGDAGSKAIEDMIANVIFSGGTETAFVEGAASILAGMRPEDGQRTVTEAPGPDGKTIIKSEYSSKDGVLDETDKQRLSRTFKGAQAMQLIFTSKNFYTAANAAAVGRDADGKPMTSRPQFEEFNAEIQMTVDSIINGYFTDGTLQQDWPTIENRLMQDWGMPLMRHTPRALLKAMGGEVGVSPDNTDRGRVLAEVLYNKIRSQVAERAGQIGGGTPTTPSPSQRPGYGTSPYLWGGSYPPSK